MKICSAQLTTVHILCQRNHHFSRPLNQTQRQSIKTGKIPNHIKTEIHGIHLGSLLMMGLRSVIISRKTTLLSIIITIMGQTNSKECQLDL